MPYDIRKLCTARKGPFRVLWRLATKKSVTENQVLQTKVAAKA